MNELPPENANSVSVDESIVDALVDYCRALDAGESVGKEELLRRHPHLKDDLSGCFEAFDFIRNAAFSIGAPQSSQESNSPRSSRLNLGDFRLIGEIGRGGMGIVYEAEQLSLGRSVAVKILPFAALLDDRQLQRFKNEARAAAILKHPNIVSVHSVGCERGVHYYAMELIKGHSLVEVNRMLGDNSRQDIAHKPGGSVEAPFASDQRTKPIAELSTKRNSDRPAFYRSAARLGIQAAEALQYAHDRGVIHRDVKPGNLLLDSEGNVHVADFGLARVQTGDDLTLTGDVVGTPRYMSPEEHDPNTVVDQRTDVYSLGISLYELVTGQPTWQSENRADLSRQILEGEPTPPSVHDPRLATSLENVLLKAIAHDRDMRYPTAQAFADDLRCFVDGKPVKAKRPTVRQRVWLWSRRSPQVAILLMLVLTLLTVFSASAAAIAIHFSRSSEMAEAEVYARTMQLVQPMIKAGNVDEAWRLLEKSKPAQGKTDRRSFEWFHYWDTLYAKAAKHVLKTGLSTFDARYSPDGTRIVTADWNGLLVLWDARTGERVKSSQYCGGILFAARFLADGETIVAMGQDGRLHTWQLEKGIQSSASVNIPTGVRVLRLDMSPDERFVAVGYSHEMLVYPNVGVGSLVVYDMKNGTTVLSVDDLSGKPSVAFSNDGETLTVGDYAGKIRVWRTGDWKHAQTLEAHSGPIYGLSFSPVRRQLASASGVFQPNEGFVAGEIHIWDTENWTLQRTLRHHEDVVRAVNFSPDGHALISGSADASVVAWNVQSGDSLFRLTGHTGPIHSLCFSPNGDSLVSASDDNTAKVWRMPQLTSADPAHTIPVRHGEYVLRLATDGDTVCSSSRRGHVKVWNARTGDELDSIDVNISSEMFTRAVPDISQNRVFVLSGLYPPRGQATAKAIDLLDGREIWSIGLPDGFIAGGAELHPNGVELMLTSNRYVVGVNKETGEQTRTIGPLCPHLKSLRFSPDGSRFACSGGGLESGIGGMTYIFAADAISSDDAMQIVKTDTKHTPACDFSPDGSLIATAGDDRVVRLWNAKTFELIREFDKHPDWVFHVRFSPDGRRILSGSKDGKVRLWDVHTGISLMTLDAADDWLWNGEFSADGSLIIAGDNQIHVWKALSLVSASPAERDEKAGKPTQRP